MLARRLGLALLWLLAVLPHVCLRSLARVFGWLIWHANGRLRRVTVRNLQICFPDLSVEARTRLARKSLRELSLGILELGRIWLWRPQRLLQSVTSVIGEEHLHAALAGGNGTMVLLPHMGSWEHVNLYLCERYPDSITAMYKPSKGSVFGDLVLQARRRTGVKMATTGSSGLRALLRSLKCGEMIEVLPDQVPPLSSGKFAPFFGEPALTMTLVANLLQRTDAKAVCGYCKRLPGGKYEIVFRPADEAIDDSDCATAVAALNKSIEHCVLDCPEQYQWQYKRFKILPNLEKRDYFSDDNHLSNQLRHRRS